MYACEYTNLRSVLRNTHNDNDYCDKDDGGCQYNEGKVWLHQKFAPETVHRHRLLKITRMWLSFVIIDVICPNSLKYLAISSQFIFLLFDTDIIAVEYMDILYYTSFLLFKFI